MPNNNIISIIESNLLALPSSLIYNLKAELKTEINRACEDTLNLIIDKVEEELINDINYRLLNIIIFKQQQINNTNFIDMNYYLYSPLNENEITFFNNFIHVTEGKIKCIFNKTLNQSGKFWLDCRLYRISTSAKTHRIKTLKMLICEKQQCLTRNLLSFKPLVGQAAISVVYGHQTEKYAFETYCKLFKVTVTKCGLLVDIIKYPWFCVSPYGTVVIDGILKKSPRN